jgi:hypothetical protein
MQGIEESRLTGELLRGDLCRLQRSLLQQWYIRITFNNVQICHNLVTMAMEENDK